MKQSGQALIILLMIMLVALTVGLAITQRSISDLAQSNREEQSSRAFSAAESGIEQAIQNPSITSAPIDLGNQATTTVRVSPSLPQAGQALEYPPVGRDTVAQFWLAQPNDLTCSTSGSICYPSGKPIDLYFGLGTIDGSGNCCMNDPQSADTAAIEVNIISLTGSDYTATRYFIDPLPSRRVNNGFCDPLATTATSTCPTFPGGTNCPAGGFPSKINTSNSQDTVTADRAFRCKVVLTTPASPIMVRARILYSNAAQPIALGPDPNCAGCSLPKQATIFTSLGSAGQVQRKLQVFKLQNVVPELFDFAIFSASNISKQ